MHQHPVETKAVSLAEAGHILNYRDPATIVRLIQTGQLQGFRARTPAGYGAWRVTCASIERFMAGKSPGGQPDSMIEGAGNGAQNAAHDGLIGGQSGDSRIPADSLPEIKSFDDKDLIE